MELLPRSSHAVGIVKNGFVFRDAEDLARFIGTGVDNALLECTQEGFDITELGSWIFGQKFALSKRMSYSKFMIMAADSSDSGTTSSAGELRATSSAGEPGCGRAETTKRKRSQESDGENKEDEDEDKDDPQEEDHPPSITFPNSSKSKKLVVRVFLNSEEHSSSIPAQQASQETGGCSSSSSSRQVPSTSGESASSIKGTRFVTRLVYEFFQDQSFQDQSVLNLDLKLGVKFQLPLASRSALIQKNKFVYGPFQNHLRACYGSSRMAQLTEASMSNLESTSGSRKTSKSRTLAATTELGLNRVVRAKVSGGATCKVQQDFTVGTKTEMIKGTSFKVIPSSDFSSGAAAFRATDLDTQYHSSFDALETIMDQGMRSIDMDISANFLLFFDTDREFQSHQLEVTRDLLHLQVTEASSVSCHPCGTIPRPKIQVLNEAQEYKKTLHVAHRINWSLFAGQTFVWTEEHQELCPVVQVAAPAATAAASTRARPFWKKPE